MALSSKGTFFVAGSGAGTFVATSAAITAYSDTGPMWVMTNRDVPGGKKVDLAYLRLKLGGTAPTATVSLELAVRTDLTSKVPTNANQYTNPTPYNTDTGDVTTSIATVYAYVVANAMVTPASSGSVRTVVDARIPTGLGIVGDEYLFQFGLGQDVAASGNMGLTAARATVPAKLIGNCPPVRIQSGIWATFHLWWLTAGTNAPSFEWELGWWEA